MNWTRPRTVWGVFLLCLTVLVGVMTWMTFRTLILEDERQRAEADRERQENIRLALWRMDAVASALVFAESARPPNQFKAFHPTDQIYTNTFQLVQKGQVLLPSPLLSDLPEHARLYFQVDARGRFSSPQAPSGNSRDLAEQNYMSTERIEEAGRLLNEVEALFPDRDWQELLPLEMGQAAPAPEPRQVMPQEATSSQRAKNVAEYNRRAQAVAQNELWSNNAPGAKFQTANTLVRQQAEEAGVNLDRPDESEPFVGRWLGSELVLTRRATLDGQSILQGVWLKADLIGELLRKKMEDLLPNGQLTPVERSEAASETGWQEVELVSLPYALNPGEGTGVPGAGAWSAAKRSLLIAWLGVAAAALAVGVLLWGIMGLSERRAAFVSAVTHEMRTPLTTFRLYSEMLSDGMVTDEERRQDYLSTLSKEADRLSHLVENVLAYARLEKGRGQARLETVDLATLIDRVRPRLEQRAGQAGMSLSVPSLDKGLGEYSSAALEAKVRVDVTAVEQILFNLVDNACKYGKAEGDEPNMVHLEADCEGGLALLRVRDHGSGISSAEARRLFRPFEKSADEAAHTAPGVGLGLSLCRKLSRVLGGDLRLDLCGANGREEEAGACFILSFPKVV